MKNHSTPQRWHRILNADEKKWKDRLLILDGIHRLMRTKLDQKETVMPKILTDADIEKILPTTYDLNQGGSCPCQTGQLS